MGRARVLTPHTITKASRSENRTEFPAPTQATDLAQARNALTHRGATLAVDEIATGLVFLGDSAFYVLTACLLSAADTSGATVDGVLSSQKCQWIAANLPTALDDVERWLRRRR